MVGKPGYLFLVSSVEVLKPYGLMQHCLYGLHASAPGDGSVFALSSRIAAIISALNESCSMLSKTGLAAASDAAICSSLVITIDPPSAHQAAPTSTSVGCSEMAFCCV